ncbi:type 4a pilus biogenesis protein PilO [Bifidobacterium adolescentis]|uniref:type 4a pilus biogenesis protein PilO n=1 Tax=Bifidobacterium adolescentis TaxID=1680 RepID=UPI003D0568C5
MNKHKIAWIALTVAIAVVLMFTWLVGVSPRLTHIKEADAQTAQIDANNKKTRDEIETLRVASETVSLQKDRLRQLQRQIPDGYNQQALIDSLNGAADGAGVSIKSVTFDSASEAEVPPDMQGTIKAGLLVQVPVTITASGSYDAMRNFVAGIQNINRIIIPEDVSYTLDKGDDPDRNGVTINCKIWSLLLNNDTVESEDENKQ